MADTDQENQGNDLYGLNFGSKTDAGHTSDASDNLNNYDALFDDSGIKFSSKFDVQTKNAPAGFRVMAKNHQKPKGPAGSGRNSDMGKFEIFECENIPNNESYRVGNPYQRFYQTKLEENPQIGGHTPGSRQNSKNVMGERHEGHLLNDTFGLADSKRGDEYDEFIAAVDPAKLKSNVLFEYSTDDSPNGTGKYQQYALIPFNIAENAPGDIGKPNLDFKGKTSDWGALGYYDGTWGTHTELESFGMHIDGLSFIDYWNLGNEYYSYPWQIVSDGLGSDDNRDGLKHLIDKFGLSLYKNVDKYKEKGSTPVDTYNDVFTSHLDDPRIYNHLKNDGKDWLEDIYPTFQTQGWQGYVGMDRESMYASGADTYPVNLARSAAAWEILYGKDSGVRDGDEVSGGTFATGEYYTGFKITNSNDIAYLKVEYVMSEAMQDQTGGGEKGRWGGLASIYEDCPIVKRDDKYYIQTKNVLWWKHLFPWWFMTSTIPGDSFPGMSNLPPDNNYVNWINIWGNSEWTSCASCRKNYEDNDISSQQGVSNKTSVGFSHISDNNFSFISNIKNVDEINHIDSKIQNTNNIEEFALEGLKTEAWYKFSNSFTSEKKSTDIFSHTFKTHDPLMFRDNKKLEIGYFWLNESDREEHGYTEYEISSSTKYHDGSVLDDSKIDSLLASSNFSLQRLGGDNSTNLIKQVFNTLNQNWTNFYIKSSHLKQIRFNPIKSTDISVKLDASEKENLIFDYELWIDNSVRYSSGSFNGDNFTTSLGYENFESINEISLRLYSNDFKQIKYEISFLNEYINKILLHKDSICFTKDQQKQNTLSFSFSYSVENAMQIMYKVNLDDDSHIEKVLNVNQYGVNNISVNTKERIPVSVEVYIIKSGEDISNAISQDSFFTINECVSSNSLYKPTYSELVYDIKNDTELSFIFVGDVEYTLTSNYNDKQNAIEVRNRNVKFLFEKSNVKLDWFVIIIKINKLSTAQIKELESIYPEYKFKEIGNIKNKTLLRIDIKDFTIFRKDLWGFVNEYDLDYGIRYKINTSNPSKKYQGFFVLQSTTTDKKNTWIVEYLNGDHTEHSFTTSFEINPKIPSPNFKQRNHIILGRSSPLHPSIYTPSNYSKTEDLIETDETSDQSLVQNEELVSEDGELNTVKALTELAASAEGQIGTKLYEQLNTLVTMQHTVNPGAWLSGTDNLFFYLDTVGGLLDIKTFGLKSLAAGGARSGIRLFAKVGKFSSILDDATGLAGAAKATAWPGRFAMYTAGHSTKNLKFMNRFSKWLIRNGITTSDALKVKWLDTSSGTVSTNYKFIDGIADHFGLWVHPFKKSKISKDFTPSDANKMYETLINKTKELDDTYATTTITSEGKLIGDNAQRMIDNFFDQLFKEQGEQILKTENPDLMTFFGNGKYWTDIVNKKDSYSVYRIINPKTYKSGTKTLRGATVTDAKLSTTYNGKKIFLPMEIIPEQHRANVVNWLNSNPKKVSKEMDDFIENNIELWTTMYKLRLIEKYEGLSLDSFMKILAVSQRYINPKYFNKEGLAVFGEGSRRTIEQVLISTLYKSKAAKKIGLEDSFSGMDKIIRNLSTEQLEEVVRHHAKHFKRKVKLSKENSKFIDSLPITQIINNIQKTLTDLNAFKSDMSSALSSGNSESLWAKYETAPEDLSDYYEYVAKYIDLYVKPYNEANVPVPTLQRLDIEDFISSINEAISTLKSNGRMATKISDSITNGDVMEIESILAKSAKNWSDSQAVRPARFDHPLDDTGFLRGYGLNVSDSVKHSGKKQATDRFFELSEKFEQSFQITPEEHQLIIAKHWLTRPGDIPELFRNIKVNITDATKNKVYQDIQNILMVGSKNYVQSDANLLKNIKFWTETNPITIKNTLYDQGDLVYGAKTVQEIQAIQDSISKYVKDAAIAARTQEGDDIGFETMLYVLNNADSIDKETVNVARDLYNIVHELSCMADDNLDAVAGYGRSVSQAEVKNLIARLNGRGFTSAGSTTETVKTNVGSGVLVSKRTQEGGFSREINSKINDKVGKFFDESFYYYKAADGTPVLNDVKKSGKIIRNEKGDIIKEYKVKNKKTNQVAWTTAPSEYIKKHGDSWSVVKQAGKTESRPLRQATFPNAQIRLRTMDIYKNVFDGKLFDDYLYYLEKMSGNTPTGPARDYVVPGGKILRYENGSPVYQFLDSIYSPNIQAGPLSFNQFRRNWVMAQAHEIAQSIRASVKEELGSEVFIPIYKEVKGSLDEVVALDRPLFVVEPKTGPKKYYAVSYKKVPVDENFINTHVGIQTRVSDRASTTLDYNTFFSGNRALNYLKVHGGDGIPTPSNIQEDGLLNFFREQLNSAVGASESKGASPITGAPTFGLEFAYDDILSSISGPQGINPNHPKFAEKLEELRKMHNTPADEKITREYEVVSANSSSPDSTYASDFGLSDTAKSYLGMQMPAGRGDFGQMNHYHSVFSALKAMKKMRARNEFDLETLVEAIHAGWANSGMTRSKSIHKLPEKLGGNIISDKQMLDTLEHIQLQLDSMFGSLAGSTDLRNNPIEKLLVLIMGSSHTEKYKNTLVKFFDELMKGIPDNMFDKKIKLGDESMELSKWFSKKDGQGRPWLTIPDEAKFSADRNAELTERWNLLTMGLANKAVELKIYVASFRNKDIKEINKLLSQIPLGGYHANNKYTRIQKGNDDFLIPFTKFEFSDGAEINPDFSEWFKYMDKNRNARKAAIDPATSFNKNITLEEKLKDLPTAVAIMSSAPEYFQHLMKYGMTIEDIDKMFMLRGTQIKNIREGIQSSVRVHGGESSLSSDMHHVAADLIPGTAQTDSVTIRLPGTSTSQIVQSPIALVKGGAVNTQNSAAKSAGRTGGISGVIADGWDFVQQTPNISKGKYNKTMIENLLDMVNRLDAAEGLGFARILGEHKFLNAIFKLIPNSKITGAIEKAVPASLRFFARTGLFARVIRAMSSRGGRRAANTGLDAGTSESSLSGVSSGWKWNTSLRGAPGILFNNIASWANAYSELEKCITDDTVNIDNWNSTIGGVVSSSGLPQKMMTSRFDWEPESQASIKVPLVDTFSWQIGQGGHISGVSIENMLDILTEIGTGTQSEVGNPSHKEALTDKILADAASVASGNSTSNSKISYAVRTGEMAVPLYGSLGYGGKFANLMDRISNPGVCWSKKEQEKRSWGYFAKDDPGSYSVELHSQDVCFACWPDHFPEAFCKESTDGTWPCGNSGESDEIDLEADEFFPSWMGNEDNSDATWLRYKNLDSEYWTYTNSGKTGNTFKPTNQGGITATFYPNF